MSCVGEPRSLMRSQRHLARASHKVTPSLLALSCHSCEKVPSVRTCAGALKSKATKCIAILLKGLPREMLHYARGRPRGERQSMAEMTRLWYLIRVSKKYGLDTHRFLACFPDAWTRQKSSYDDILIQRRQKTNDNGVFLVTQDQKVIAQLYLGQKMLKYLPEVDLASFPCDERPRVREVETSQTGNMQIKNIDAGVKWVNLKARVVEKSIPRNVFTSYGDRIAVSTATISDNTGSIRLPLWNAQIDMVSIGDTVQIENGRVKTFRGELQVSVGRNSKLQVIENQSTPHTAKSHAQDAAP